MIFFLICLYPFYRTGEAIRYSNKTKKSEFEHWLTFWYVYALSACFVREIVLLIYNWIYLPATIVAIFDCALLVLLMACYFSRVTKMVRSYALLRLMRDGRVWGRKVIAVVEPHLEWVKVYHWYETVRVSIINAWAFLNTAGVLFSVKEEE